MVRTREKLAVWDHSVVFQGALPYDLLQVSSLQAHGCYQLEAKPFIHGPLGETYI